MIAVVQRVSSASVTVTDECLGRIGRGLVALVGARKGDDAEDARLLADKLAGLRIFEDAGGRMNSSALDLGVEILVISQFTLLADLKKGRRPGFDRAEDPDRARALLDQFVRVLEGQGLTVEQGRFGAEMSVQLVNHGPATFILDTDLWRPRSRRDDTSH